MRTHRLQIATFATIALCTQAGLRGASYPVTVIGMDPDTGDEIFRHEQDVLFYPPRDLASPVIR